MGCSAFPNVVSTALPNIIHFYYLLMNVEQKLGDFAAKSKGTDGMLGPFCMKGRTSAKCGANIVHNTILKHLRMPWIITAHQMDSVKIPKAKMGEAKMVPKRPPPPHEIPDGVVGKRYTHFFEWKLLRAENMRALQQRFYNQCTHVDPTSFSIVASRSVNTEPCICVHELTAMEQRGFSEEQLYVKAIIRHIQVCLMKNVLDQKSAQQSTSGGNKSSAVVYRPITALPKTIINVPSSNPNQPGLAIDVWQPKVAKDMKLTRNIVEGQLKVNWKTTHPYFRQKMYSPDLPQRKGHIEISSSEQKSLPKKWKSLIKKFQDSDLTDEEAVEFDTYLCRRVDHVRRLYEVSRFSASMPYVAFYEDWKCPELFKFTVDPPIPILGAQQPKGRVQLCTPPITLSQRFQANHTLAMRILATSHMFTNITDGDKCDDRKTVLCITIHQEDIGQKLSELMRYVSGSKDNRHQLLKSSMRMERGDKFNLYANHNGNRMMSSSGNGGGTQAPPKVLGTCIIVSRDAILQFVGMMSDNLQVPRESLVNWTTSMNTNVNRFVVRFTSQLASS